MPNALPEELAIAQDAIQLPEVQEMMRKLAAYHLGVYMPHMHDDKGALRPLPEGITQVEDNLKVSFQSAANSAEDPLGLSYIPVAWFWRDGPTPGATCTSRCNRAHHAET
jgi:hypothetical protein